MGRQPKIVPPKKPNPLRNHRPIIAPPPLIQKATASAAAAAQAASRPARRACPNKECSAPDVVDGICHSCGFVVDDSNIVSEIQFGESSNGAAVVQGSFVSADQGAAKSLGPAFRRAGGGGEDREATIREGRRFMQALANQLEIPDPTVNSGVQIFKLAAINNFIQGRRMDMVSAVCLYSACRKEKPCRVMLIDFADKVQVNVFKLGHTFKALHNTVTLAKDGIQPVLPEDLIYRFATKLEFGILTNKVAEDAVRMVQRMSLDWMVMGRRPSGVCGACLILAARMNNFRRTITEVVYIVKVTTHTIQKRLDEFKVTPSSALTVEEFLHNEFLESAHDPPSFYEKSEEWQSNKKKRKRRRGRDGAEEDAENSEGEDGDDSNKRQKTAIPGPDQPVQSVELRRDADGFAIPPQPVQTQEIPIDPDLVDDAIEDRSGTSFEKLVAEFGDSMDEERSDEEDRASTSSASVSTPRKTGNRNRPINVPEEWASVEDAMEFEISEMISDPNTVLHATSYAQAKRRAAAHMLIAERTNPQRHVNMDVHIGEDEFANDPEVLNCMLAPEEVAKKEKVWVNENKSWLRKQQIKMWQKKLAENGPPKAKRNRKKKPRMGEGQTSAASSPAEAAVNVMKERAFSKKINYDAIRSIFDGLDKIGSATNSQVTSRAGSEFNDSILTGSRASSSAATSNPPSLVGDTQSDAGSEITSTLSRVRASPRPQAVPPSIASTSSLPTGGASTSAAKPDEDVGDDDDYVTEAATHEEDEDVDDWRAAIKSARNQTAGEDEAPDDEEDYSDYGGVEPGGLEGLDDEESFGGGFEIEDDE